MRRAWVAALLLASCPHAAPASPDCQALLSVQRLIANGVDRQFISDDDLRAMIAGEQPANPLRSKSLDSRAQLLAGALDQALSRLSGPDWQNLKRTLAEQIEKSGVDQIQIANARDVNALVVNLTSKEFAPNFALRPDAALKMRDGRVIVAASDQQKHYIVWIDGKKFEGELEDVAQIFFPIELKDGELAFVIGRAEYDIHFYRFDIASNKFEHVRKIEDNYQTVPRAETRRGQTLDGRPYVTQKIGPFGGMEGQLAFSLKFLDEEKNREVVRFPERLRRDPLILRGEAVGFSWFKEVIGASRVLAGAKFEGAEASEDIAGTIVERSGSDREVLFLARRGQPMREIDLDHPRNKSAFSLFGSRDGDIFAAISIPSTAYPIWIHGVKEDQHWSKVIRFTGADRFAWTELKDGRVLLVAMNSTHLAVYEPGVSEEALGTIELPTHANASSTLHVLNYADGKVDLALGLKGGAYIYRLADEAAP